MTMHFMIAIFIWVAGIAALVRSYKKHGLGHASKFVKVAGGILLALVALVILLILSLVIHT